MGYMPSVVREMTRADYCGSGGSTEVVDPDRLEDLGDEIITLFAHRHALDGRILRLLGRFDRLRGWEAGGHRTCAHWLAYRAGLDLGTAREHVRVGRALEELPRTLEAMERGELSFSQARALTRVATADTEEDLLALACGCTAAQLERMVRAWKKGTRQEEALRERERHLSRKWSVFPDDDGMYVVVARLDPEAAAVLMRAVDAATDALYRERRSDPDLVGPRDSEREAARLRADAIGLVAERALAAGFGSTAVDPPAPGGDADPEVAEDEAEPCGCGSGAAREVPISGTRPERYQVFLHVDADTLSEDREPGRSELEDGTRVSAETSRRLSCDAAVVRVACGPDGSPLDVGRRTRTVPNALRRALEVRDRGCRFPGCGLRFTEGHHIVHWADSGPTNLENTLLLCRHHHRLVHEGGWSVEWWGKGRPAFRDPKGSVHMQGRRRTPRLPADPVAALIARNRQRGADPDGWTASPRWKFERDIPDEVYFRATEAL